MFKVWMDLLKEVPGSVLWLMKLNETAQANLTKEALKHGVDPARLVYATRVPRVEDHLARYRLADLFLDTFPYNGHTTAGDALRAELPVLTLHGSSLASRVASSLLNDVGLSDLTFDSANSYKIMALQHAKDKAFRGRVLERLKQAINTKKWPPTTKQQCLEFEFVLNQIKF